MKILTTTQAVKILGVSNSTVIRLAQAGEIGAVRTRTRWVFDEASVLAYANGDEASVKDMTTKEAADSLGICTSTLLKARQRSQIAGTKNGCAYTFTEAAVEGYRKFRSKPRDATGARARRWSATGAMALSVAEVEPVQMDGYLFYPGASDSDKEWKWTP